MSLPAALAVLAAVVGCTLGAGAVTGWLIGTWLNEYRP